MRVVNLFVVIVPFVGLLAAIILLWGRGFSWIHLGLMLGMYCLTILGVTVGFHRLFTHKSYETSRAVKLILSVLGSMAIEGPLIKWVALHRRHHQHSDRVDDPHSPHVHGKGFSGLVMGLWHAHMGWMFRPDSAELPRYVADLVNDSMLCRVSKQFTLWATIGLLFPALLGGLLTWSWTGALLGFIWGGLARVFLVHHVTWSINSICHIWGGKPFRSHDESRNNFLLAILGMGEGWHNNHHAFPTSARHGLKWWQIDVSYLIIRGMAAVGLAWDLRLPSAQAMMMKRATT